MRRVLCIAPVGNWKFVEPVTVWFLFKKTICSGGPQFGEICTVTGQYTSENDKELYYLLAEYQHKPEAGYYAKWFIPLSNLDEETILLKRIIEEQTN